MNKISKACTGLDLLEMRNFCFLFSSVALCAKNSCHLSGRAVSLCDTGDVWTQKDQKVMSDIHTSVARETLHDSRIISTKRQGYCNTLPTQSWIQTTTQFKFWLFKLQQTEQNSLQNTKCVSKNKKKLCPEFRSLSISFTHLLLQQTEQNSLQNTKCALKNKKKLCPEFRSLSISFTHLLLQQTEQNSLQNTKCALKKQEKTVSWI